jgi:ATP-dependent helicase/nuclease subunit A
MILDQEYRDVARRILDQNVVVEAGAGTGKTTLLTDRLLFLLLAGGRNGQGLDVSRLAAMTFTEKAAGEIKVRLSSRLHDIIAVIDGRSLPEPRQSRAVDWLMEVKQYFKRTPEQVRTSAEAALSHMDRANIGTIHAFAASLLRTYPLQAGVDPRVEVDEGTAFDELFQTEWFQWLEGELGTKPPRASQWIEVLSWASLEDLADLARALSRENAGETSFGPSQRMKDTLRGFYENIQRISLGKPEPGAASKILESLPPLTSHLHDLQEAIGNAQVPLPPRPRSDGARVRKWPKSWDGLDGETLYTEATALALDTSAFSEVLIRRAVDLVKPFCDAFRETYLKRGWIGFDGLLLKARALVRDRVDVRQELKKRFDAILVDEFQDTDPLQGEMILFLAEEPSGAAKRWEDIRFAPGKLFVVGDPKQSIYRFRGADIRAYSRFTQMILGQGGLRCPLQTNFRSHRGLVDPVNFFFRTLMKEDKGLQPAYLPLHPRPSSAVPEDSPFGAPVELALTVSGKEGEPLTARDSQQAEALWIASWIVTHCTRPPSADGAAKGIRFGDVAVLFRTTSPLEIYLEVFKEAKIPYVVESDRTFYATQEVTDFINLLRVLDDPQDVISLVGVLRSPLVGLDDKDIHHLRIAGELDYQEEPAKGTKLTDLSYYRVKSLYTFLRKMRNGVGKSPLGEFVSSLLRESFLLELSAAAYHQEQTLSNLMKLGRLAVEAGERRGITLKEFIETASRAVKEAVEEGESPLADEHLDAVRVLTVHKAKGLEYPVVILPNLSASSGRGRSDDTVMKTDWEEGLSGLRLPRTKAVDTVMSFLKRAEEKREDAERVRLLYVALTRAREKVILLGRAQGGDKKSFSSFLFQAGAWPKPGESPAELLLLDGGRVPVTYIAPEGTALVKSAVPQSRPRIGDGTSLALVWKRRYETREAQRAMMTFDTPTRYLQEESKPAVAVVEESLVAGVSSLVGQVCHRVLEDWDYRKVDDLSDRIARAYQVLKQRHPVAYWSPVARESEKVLEDFLASPVAQALAQCEILGREMPFVFHGREGIMRGSLDLLYRRDGRLWVADYKTDRVPPDQIALHAQRYEKQGRAYVDAVEKALGERCNFQIIYLRLGQSVDIIQ